MMVSIYNTLFEQESSYVGPQVLPGEATDAWFTLTDLFSDDAAALMRHMRQYGKVEHAPDDTSAAYFIGWMTGLLARPAVWSWKQHRLVPEYRPDLITFRTHSTGWYDAVSFGATPGTDHAKTEEDVARKALSNLILEFGNDLVGAISPHTRLGNRALWSHVTDTYANAFLPRPPLGEAAVRATEIADLALQAADFPTPGPNWEHYEGASVGLGQSCCLTYKIPGGTNCAPVCPKIDPESRKTELVKWRNALPDRRTSD